MQLQIETQHDLGDEEEHQPVRERGVDVRAELAASVGVTEEVGHDGDDGSDDLNGDVPARADDLYSDQSEWESRSTEFGYIHPEPYPWEKQPQTRNP